MKETASHVRTQFVLDTSFWLLINLGGYDTNLHWADKYNEKEPLNDEFKREATCQKSRVNVISGSMQWAAQSLKGLCLLVPNDEETEWNTHRCLGWVWRYSVYWRALQCSSCRRSISSCHRRKTSYQSWLQRVAFTRNYLAWETHGQPPIEETTRKCSRLSLYTAGL